MNLEQALAYTREILDDLGGDRDIQWAVDDSTTERSNAALMQLLEHGRAEYLAARPIRDNRTAALCEVTAEAAGEGFVTLDPRVLYVRSVRLASDYRVLEPVAARVLDREVPDWHGREPGDPRWWVLDEDAKDLRVWPFPAVDTALRLAVDRLALEPLTLEARQEEVADVPALHHEWLCWYAAGMALHGVEVEATDRRLGAELIERFWRALGGQVSAKQHAVRRRFAAGPVRVRGLQIARLA